MRIQISEAAPRVMNYFLARSQGIPADTALHAMTDYTSPLIETLRAHHRLQTHEDAQCRIASARIESPTCLHYGTTVNIAALRCYLTVVYGNFLEVPEALLSDQINYRNLWSTSARCGE